jgi:hypothetical protein
MFAAVNWRTALGQGIFSFSRLGISDDRLIPQNPSQQPTHAALFAKRNGQVLWGAPEVRDELDWKVGYNLSENHVLPPKPRFYYELPRWIVGFGAAWSFSLENGMTHPLPNEAWRLAVRYIDLFGPSRNPYRSGTGLAFLFQYEIGKAKKRG